MKLVDALQGVGVLGLDTAPLIYLIEKHPAYIDRMEFILRLINSGAISAVGSMMTLTEVLVQPLRTGSTALVQDYEKILLNSSGFELVVIDAGIARKAAELRARYGLKTPDAMQVATCLEMKCEAFLTNDLGIKRVSELRVLVLDELEVG